MSETDWAEQAACRGANPEIFFPSPGDAVEDARIAKAICARCPVIEACAEAGRDELYGTWGGMTHLDRRRRRRDRREQDNGEWFRLGHLARGLGVDAKLLHRWRISGRIETQLIANVWHAKLSEVADEVAIHRKKSA